MFTEARGVFRVLCYATSQPISSNAGGLFLLGQMLKMRVYEK